MSEAANVTVFSEMSNTADMVRIVIIAACNFLNLVILHKIANSHHEYVQ